MEIENIDVDHNKILDDDVKIIEKMACDGDAGAQLILFSIYYDGEYNHKKVVQDKEKAFYWLRKACESDNIHAKSVLGLFTLHDEQAEARKEGVLLIKEAAYGGDVFAQFTLSDLYKKGYKVPLNRTESEKWLNMALRQIKE